MKSKALILISLFVSPSLFAQNTMASAIVKHWQSSKDLTLAVANAMPDDGYSFKATDAEMSFGEQMNHIAMGNMNYCSAALGEKPSTEKPADNTKATAVKSLNAAFDYCIAGVQKMSDADLEKTVTRGSNVVTKFELFWGGFTHTAHHRGQAEVYLRLKGVTPPSYKF